VGLMKNRADAGERIDTSSFAWRYPGWVRVLVAWRKSRPDAAEVLRRLARGEGTQEERDKWHEWYQTHVAKRRKAVLAARGRDG